MIYNLGSINADFFYRVPRLPAPGETVAAASLATGLGGKGANQSVAVARAGSGVRHIGAVGHDGDAAVAELAAAGVDTAHVARVQEPTGHAIVSIDPAGENAIVIYPGANRAQQMPRIEAALSGAGPGDWLMLQNETSHQAESAALARARGLSVVYSAAPFAPEAVAAVLGDLMLLILNAVEAEQLSATLNTAPRALPVPHVLITKGADGAEWIDTDSGETVSVPAVTVTPVDSTGAGDTFAGYAVAGLAQGFDRAAALSRAAAAAALQVTRRGTAAAIPSSEEVAAFLR